MGAGSSTISIVVVVTCVVGASDVFVLVRSSRAIAQS